MDNVLNNIGDQIIFKTVPMYNLVSLVNFSDNVLNITMTRTIQRMFCYSMDGVVFTDWVDFTLPQDIFNPINADLKINPKGGLVIQIMYIRTGIDATGEIVVQLISMNGTYDYNLPQFPSIQNTVFQNYVYNDIDVYNLAVNLAQKMYDEGIVPVYMERGEVPNNLYNDKDYVDFWFTISKMFAIIFKYNIQYTVLYWRKEFLTEFLTENNIFFDLNSDITLLQQLAKNYYDEIRQRGTVEIFRRQDYVYPAGHRNSYKLPTGFAMSPANPIFINDILFRTPNDLDFGWVKAGDSLIAPDQNDYKIEIVDNSGQGLMIIDSSFDYSIIPNLPRIDLSIPFAILNPTKFSSIIRKYHGEYLRLICYAMNLDEFMFNVITPQNRGWCIGHSSPLWRGLRQHENTTIIKGYENFSEQVYDLNYYPITPPPPPPSSLLLWLSPILSGASVSYAIDGLVMTQGTTHIVIQPSTFYSPAGEVAIINYLNSTYSSLILGSFAIVGNYLVYNPALSETWSISTAANIYKYELSTLLKVRTVSSSPQLWSFISIQTGNMVVDWLDTNILVYTVGGTISHTYSDSLTNRNFNIFHNNLNISIFDFSLLGSYFNLGVFTGLFPLSLQKLTIRGNAMQPVANLPISTLVNLTVLNVSQNQISSFTPDLFIGTFNSLNNINIGAMNLSSAQVDQLFNDFVTNTPSFSSGGVFNTAAQVPAAPPTSTSLTARNTLIAHGWTLTTD